MDILSNSCEPLTRIGETMIMLKLNKAQKDALDYAMRIIGSIGGSAKTSKKAESSRKNLVKANRVRLKKARKRKE